MSSVSKRGHRQALTDKQYSDLRTDLRKGNRARRRRALALLAAEDRRNSKVIDAQNRRMGISSSLIG